ncbi:MAG TPA: cation transporter [Lutibacter sp.]|nr:cation transporter [Lutibacter sp.]
MSHDHKHHHPKLSGKNLLFTILLNVGITVAQLIAGFVSGSLALLSDAVHNLSDVLALIISYVANRLSNRRKQNLGQTFGYKRAEIIAAFFNAATLIVIAVFLAIEAIKRLTNPIEIGSNLVIWLALVGILGNGLGVLLLKKDAEHNLNMKSAYLHLMTDMLTSVAVLIGGLLMKFHQIYWVDAVLTIIISVYLIYMSWRIFVDSLKILMLFAPDHIIIKDVEKAILEISKIRNIHHVHVWQLNDHTIHFEAHIEFKKDVKLSEFDIICAKIEHLLAHKFEIHHSNLQPEFERDDNKEFIIQD